MGHKMSVLSYLSIVLRYDFQLNSKKVIFKFFLVIHEKLFLGPLSVYLKLQKYNNRHCKLRLFTPVLTYLDRVTVLPFALFIASRCRVWYTPVKYRCTTIEYAVVVRDVSLICSVATAHGGWPAPHGPPLLLGLLYSFDRSRIACGRAGAITTPFDRCFLPYYFVIEDFFACNCDC